MIIAKSMNRLPLPISSTRTFRDSTHCPTIGCSSQFSINDYNLDRYIHNWPIRCISCKIEINWWTELLRHFTNPFAAGLFAMVGGWSTFLSVELTPGKMHALNLQDVGVPKDATILHIHYNGQAKPDGSEVIPIEFHGNSPFHWLLSHSRTIYAVPQGNPSLKGLVSAIVIWAEFTGENHSLKNLITAFDAFHKNNLAQAIVPASVAIEAPLSLLLQGQERRLADSAKYEDGNLKSYGVKLNELLPEYARLANYPVLKAEVMEALNEMKEHRNSIAHEGRTKTPITSNDLSRMLPASYIAIGYLRLLKGKAYPALLPPAGAIA